MRCRRFPKTVKSGHMASAKINHTATNLNRQRVSRRDQRSERTPAPEPDGASGASRVS